ncbi:MAG TPA: type II secretion system F family protein [Gemmatimonadota bacterium]|jgi:tight adherence protein B
MVSGLILAAVFLTVVLAIWGGYLLVAQAPLREQQKLIGWRVESLARARERGLGSHAVDIFRKDVRSMLPRLQGLLLRLPRVGSLERALQQADWRISVTTFVLLSLVLATGFYLLADTLWNFLPLSVVLGSFGLCIPYVILTYRRRKRFDTFLQQLPEAIDLVGRAVRAGHAVPTGFEMVSQEMEPPIAEEFRRAYEQQKFGLPLNQALMNMQERLPLMDVRMLVTAIAIQREVGGNLGEVLDKIAHTIRERMRIRGQVRVYTAQGKMTGTVLAALPIFVGFIVFTLNKDYFQILFQHEYGLFMIGMAILLEIVGYFWIRKIIHIKI